MVLSKGSSKHNEGFRTSKTVGTSKFKVYSEKSKVNRMSNSDFETNSLSASLVLQNKVQLSSNTGINKASIYGNSAELTRSNYDSLDKLNPQRKALADLSNIQGQPSRLDKPGGFRSSLTSGTASSNQSLAGKSKGNLSRGVVTSKTSGNVNTKVLRTSLNFQRVPISEMGLLTRQISKSNNLTTRSSLTSGTASSNQSLAGKSKGNLTHGVVTSKTFGNVNSKVLRTSLNFHRVPISEMGLLTRQTSKSNNLTTRKSFPVLKRANHRVSSDIQVSVKSAEKSATKVGFPVKPRAGGKLVTQVSNLKGKVSKGKANDGFTLKAMKYQDAKNALGGVKTSVKPIAKTHLQTFNGQKHLRDGSNCSLDKSLHTTSTRRTKLVTHYAERSEPTSSCVKVSGNPAQANDKTKSESLETMVNKKSGRRKSYTSSLISRSKLIELSNEVREEDQLPNIDDEDNPLEVAEYVDDIYEYYWIMEAQYAPLESYLMTQADVTPHLRGILINWLIEVHLKFELMPETLYLTVALLDRYLTIAPIKKKELQLVGLSALLLASKYEDFWHPRVKDLISISAEPYTREQILEMEKNILKKLRFRMNLPTAYVFMLRFLKASQSSKKHEHLAFYLIELCLVEHETLRFRPSLLCASSVYVARCTLNDVPAWTSLLEKHARYEEHQIRDCAEIILKIHKGASSRILKVTCDKYMQPKFGRVAAIKPLDNLPR